MKLIATDLDGTLVRSDGSVSPRTVAALARAEAAGLAVLMVTGRPPRWMSAVAQAIGNRGQAICANGAVLYDLRAERILSRKTIPEATLAEVIARLRAELPELRFAVEYGEGFVFEARYQRGGWDLTAMGGEAVDDTGLIARPATKLLGLHPGADPDALMSHAAKAVGDLVTITRASSRSLLEISALGVTKATALEEYCAARGVTASDVVAFGDMPNDLPMLTWAGRPYAMANAHPAVLAAIPARTPADNDGDGVAAVLEHLLDGR
ncbi:Cof-type HAD-IIB family hydrolase [Actinocorallia sp. API 0066]|uniref:HAD family hydrolase n=1 Tax=Actinocorallia sp. API 0066 TaxID=2896846 RepID=UPI001E361283|nr:HAD family hydrolase [Actinocorallia sp. API 0066]MCD0452523.1 Cof-type HAD-IIB family hydrolase [Actinocorallia sp. API 0066]